MNCKFHPEEEAVTTCDNCGAEICSKCANEAYHYTDYDTKKGPWCLACARKRCEDKISEYGYELKPLKKKLIFATIFICISILFFIFSDGEEGYIYVGIGFWFLSGLVQTWRQEKDASTVKSIIWGDPNEEKGCLTFIFQFIFYILAAPICLIRNFKDYKLSKKLYDSFMQDYEEIQKKYRIK